MFHGINTSFHEEVLPMGITCHVAHASYDFSNLQKMLTSTAHLAPEALIGAVGPARVSDPDPGRSSSQLLAVSQCIRTAAGAGVAEVRAIQGLATALRHQCPS